MSAPSPSRRRALGGPDAPVVVLAGGTGTGKSTLARALGARGAAVIEADRVGHEILLEPAVREAVVAAFDPSILGPDGEIERSRLGALVFGDEDARRRLDAIVHPPLVAEIARRVDHLRATRAVKLVVIDAALWTVFDAPGPSFVVDLLVMTTAPVELRQARIVERDGLDPDAASARIRAQAGIDASLPRADAVLDTATDPATTVATLLELLDARLGTRLADARP